jgi:hypothetical protein
VGVQLGISYVCPSSFQAILTRYSRSKMKPFWEPYERAPGSEKPPCKTSHASVTHGDHIIMFVAPLSIVFPFVTTHCRFGGANGQYHYNDIWLFDVSTRTGYIPSPREGHAAALVDDVMKSDLLSAAMQTLARCDCFKTPNTPHLNASLVQKPLQIIHIPARQPSSPPPKHGQSAPNPRSTHCPPHYASFRRSDYPLRLHHVLSRCVLIPIKRCSFLAAKSAVCKVRYPIPASSLPPHPFTQASHPQGCAIFVDGN